MEAVGLASGIAGIMTLAIQVSGAIHEYSSAIKNQSKTIQELEDELMTLANALSEFKTFLSKNEDEQLKFDDESVLAKAYSDCKAKIEEISREFPDIKKGSKIRRVWSKFKWPFEQKEVMIMVENLRRYTQVFNFAININNCKILAKTSNNVATQLRDLHEQANKAIEMMQAMPEIFREDAMKRSAQLQSILDLIPTLSQQAGDIRTMKDSMKEAEEREQRRLKSEILNWLVSDGGLSKHPEMQKKRAKDTCQWFLEDEHFVRWTRGHDGSKDFLCVGGPGTGKSILCSIVIDHLKNLHSENGSAVLHYYCDFFEKTVQTSSHFARSLLRQLVMSYNGIPVPMLEFYRKTNHALQDFMWLQQLHVVLQKVIPMFDMCFLVLDAIDETDVREQRKGIFEVLNVLRSSKGHLRTLATARPHVGDIERQFPGVRPYEIGASSADIYKFLETRMDENSLSSDILDKSLRAEILSSLCDIAQGMFLLPALQIDYILEQVTTGGARKALKDLSRTLPELFKSTMQRISKFPSAKKDLAMKVLLWISHAEKPLTISELQHALAVDIDTAEFDDEDIPAVNTLIESCCGLVELVGDPMEERPSLVTFVHFSLQEYLLREENDQFSNGDLVITKTCLRYLSYESLQFVAQSNRKILLRTLSHFPFLEYASLFWGYHALDLPVDSYSAMAMALFNDRNALFLTLRVRDAGNPNDSKWEETTNHLLDSGSGGISIAANFGLAALLQRLIDEGPHHDLNVKNIYGSTPLHECAITGSIETARVLISNGADVLSLNKGGATPFYLAVAFDRVSLCQVLLEKGSEQVNIPRNHGDTPLHQACEFGTPMMVTLLLQAGAKFNVTNDPDKSGKMTPLHLACRRGNLPTVHLLVNAGANLELRNSDGCSALDLAATHGHYDLARYLIENGAKLDGKSAGGWTPLHRAARSRQVETAQLLLENGANLLERDGRRSLPLTLAVKQGDMPCMKLFLEYRPMFALHQLQNLDIEGESAKIKAYSTSHYDLYKYLRDLEIKLLGDRGNSKPIQADPTLPMILAIEKGSLEEVVRLLTTNPDLLMMRDSLGQLPLHTAFLEEQLEIAVEFLDRGVPINVQGYHNWTPLHIAAAAGSFRMLSLALQYHADIHAESTSNNNALHKAASAHSMPVLLELLRCGADPYSRNDHLMTPLHIAANHNFVDAARELLRPKWRRSIPSSDDSSNELIFLTDKRKHMPRWWAEQAGHLELADFLRFEERKAKSSTKLGTNRPISSRRSTLQQTPKLPSRTSTGFDSLSSYAMSRTSTRETLSTRATSTSLLSPPLGTLKPGHMSRRSTGSLFSNHDEEGDDWSEGLPSPARTPTLLMDGQYTPLLRDESLQRKERSYARMLLEYDSD